VIGSDKLYGQLSHALGAKKGPKQKIRNEFHNNALYGQKQNGCQLATGLPPLDT